MCKSVKLLIRPNYTVDLIDGAYIVRNTKSPIELKAFLDKSGILAVLSEGTDELTGDAYVKFTFRSAMTPQQSAVYQRLWLYQTLGKPKPCAVVRERHRELFPKDVISQLIKIHGHFVVNSCLRKYRHKSQVAAKTACNEIRSRADYVPRPGKWLRPYACEQCRGFHAGHASMICCDG